ncbi:hypothetical protein C8R47DRAFT_1106499 [Mycena vitilis]|nr:hypothetical protein C8R47DRAFT_1106499 [Mycena vitilis]
MAQAFDTIFQILSVVSICFRSCVFYPRILILMLPAGLLGPVLNVAIPNQSIFPQCRAIISTAPSELGEVLAIIWPSPTTDRCSAKLVPCLRALFDIAAAILMLVFLRPFLRPKLKQLAKASPSRDLAGFFGWEACKDLMLLSGLLVVESICVQVPSVRITAQNFIIPFIDSLGAITLLGFLIELWASGVQPDEECDSTDSESLNWIDSLDDPPDPRQSCGTTDGRSCHGF